MNASRQRHPDYLVIFRPLFAQALAAPIRTLRLKTTIDGHFSLRCNRIPELRLLTTNEASPIRGRHSGALCRPRPAYLDLRARLVPPTCSPTPPDLDDASHSAFHIPPGPIMNGTQQTQDVVAQQPLQPAAANANANANANGSSTAAKKRKKDSLKPIITTETPPAPSFTYTGHYHLFILHHPHHYPSILSKSAAPGAARSSLRSVAGRSTGASNTDQASLSLSSPTGPVQVQIQSSSVRSSPSWHSGSRGQRPVSVPSTAPRSLSHTRSADRFRRTLRHRCQKTWKKSTTRRQTTNTWGSIQWDQRWYPTTWWLRIGRYRCRCTGKPLVRPEMDVWRAERQPKNGRLPHAANITGRQLLPPPTGTSAGATAAAAPPLHHHNHRCAALWKLEVHVLEILWWHVGNVGNVGMLGASTGAGAFLAPPLVERDMTVTVVDHGQRRLNWTD
ncbi:hypothetical protein CORC01_11328 [Colletotrichum orchidophilum]|uniref:Uncharacterized protein n=1 Tax=Colletotrichum orchidophilum TaxID=1209926 RepID=A0A1G4AW40_9PEZI|nr:uncharacterized protein CORC01_11328 [Colletotrichum orchidophilum]OHE93378.1 hypothetical protein CORC01_11328 [Colletotrichum orchidophilum]